MTEWEMVRLDRVYTEEYVDLAKIARSAAKQSPRFVMRWVRQLHKGLYTPYIKRRIALVVDGKVALVARQNARGSVYWDDAHGAFQVEEGAA